MNTSLPSSVRLTVGIVSYNCAATIGQTVDSLVTNLPDGHDWRLIIFDNRSTDMTPQVLQRLATRDQRIIVISSARNLGFGRGHNAILQRVASTFHIICNPDIRITPGAVNTLLNFMERHPRGGVVCPRVHYPSGDLQPLNRRLPNVFDLFLRRFAPALLRRRFKARMARYCMLDEGYACTCSVPFVSGAFMTCRTRVLKAVGGFDRRYFLYFEDADLSRKVQMGGWQTLYCPEAVVIHEWQRAAHKNLQGMIMFMMSALRYFNKWGWKLS